jgi:hypothetical protein
VQRRSSAPHSKVEHSGTVKATANFLKNYSFGFEEEVKRRILRHYIGMMEMFFVGFAPKHGPSYSPTSVDHAFFHYGAPFDNYVFLNWFVAPVTALLLAFVKYHPIAADLLWSAAQ